MKYLSNYKNIFIVTTAMMAVVFSFTGCNSNSTGTDKTALAPVTNLKAFSVSDTSVGLTWTPSAKEGVSEFAEYTITAKKANGDITASTSASAGDTSYTVLSLTEGVIYTFEIVVTATDGAKEYKNSGAVSVKWSPSRRLNTEGGSSLPIKVYETSSVIGGSGLILYRTAVSGPLAVSIIGADSNDVDLYAKTEPNNSISFISFHLYHAGSGKHITRFSSVVRNAASLDDPQLMPPDTGTYSPAHSAITIDSLNISSSKIFYFKSNNGNYGRILVQANGNSLLWGTSPDQYLNLKISYQTAAYNPYSKTKHP